MNTVGIPLLSVSSIRFSTWNPLPAFSILFSKGSGQPHPKREAGRWSDLAPRVSPPLSCGMKLGSKHFEHFDFSSSSTPNEDWRQNSSSTC